MLLAGGSSVLSWSIDGLSMRGSCIFGISKPTAIINNLIVMEKTCTFYTIKQISTHYITYFCIKK